ncbi:hypothetical protein D3C73_1558130 [compost metagenome]
MQAFAIHQHCVDPVHLYLLDFAVGRHLIGCFMISISLLHPELYAFLLTGEDQVDIFAADPLLSLVKLSVVKGTAFR